MKYNEEKIQEKYKSFLNKIGHGQRAISNIEALVKLTGIEPSKENLKKGYLKSLEGSLSEVEQKNLKELSDKYGILSSVSEDEVQAIYKKHLEEGRIYKVRDVVKITGIKPIFDKELVQKAYTTALQSGVCIGHISNFIKFSGIEPEFSEEIIQQKYSDYLKESYPEEELSKLIELSKIRPEIDENLIQGRFKRYLNEANFETAKRLRDILNIDFSKEMVLGLHAQLIRDGSYGFLSRLIECTEINPPQQMIQEKYSELFTEKDFSGIIMLKEILQVDPEIDAAKIQEIYSTFSEGSFLFDIEDIKNLTGIPPNNTNIQRWYQLLIEKDDFRGISELQNATGIELGEEANTLLENRLNS